MSRVTVESRTPTWQVGSLDRTRIKNDLRGEVIIFKEVQWQAVRIEANALTDWILTTPLRLIANQSKIRITLKKRMAGKFLQIAHFFKNIVVRTSSCLLCYSSVFDT